MQRRYMIPLLILAVFVLACSCLPASLAPPADGAPNEPGVVPAAQTSEPDSNSYYEQASQFTGLWTGNWVNLTFGSTGEISVLIDVQPDGTASFELTVTGNVFGAGDQPTAIYPGTYDASGLHFEGTGLPIFGDLQIVITYPGEVTMAASVLPMANIASVSSEGMVTGDEMTLAYTVIFAAGGEANGTAAMTRTP